MIADVALNYVKEPCPQCPFRRDSRAGYLGGTSPAGFIGQAHGPFALPCHMHGDFTPQDRHGKAMDAPQCAGAAAYRAAYPANFPDHPPLPARLKSEPHPDVFAHPAEFYAHHAGITLEDAQTLVTKDTVNAATFDQIHRAHHGLKP
jgi:hypothetical protein